MITYPAAIDRDAEWMLRAQGTQDHKEAVRAFVEKRKPIFIQALVVGVHFLLVVAAIFVLPFIAKIAFGTHCGLAPVSWTGEVLGSRYLM